MKIEIFFGRHIATPGNFYGRGYAYECHEPVQVGDIVQLPGNAVNPEPQEGTVIALDSAYEGDMATVVKVVERKNVA